MKNIIFWNVTPYNVVVHECFGGSYCFYLQGQIVGSAFFLHLAGWLLGLLYDPDDGESMLLRKFVKLYQTTRCHIARYNIRHSCRCENLISNEFMMLSILLWNQTSAQRFLVDTSGNVLLHGTCSALWYSAVFLSHSVGKLDGNVAPGSIPDEIQSRYRYTSSDITPRFTGCLWKW